MGGSLNLHRPVNHERKNGYRQAALILGPPFMNYLTRGAEKRPPKITTSGTHQCPGGSMDGPAPGTQSLLTSHATHHSTTRVLILYNIKSELARELCCGGFCATFTGFAPRPQQNCPAPHTGFHLHFTLTMAGKHPQPRTAHQNLKACA